MSEGKTQTSQPAQNIGTSLPLPHRLGVPPLKPHFSPKFTYQQLINKNPPNLKEKLIFLFFLVYINKKVRRL